MGSRAVLSKLRNICVVGCLRVTHACLQHFISRQSELVTFKSLDIQRCPKVSIFGLEALQNLMGTMSWKIVSEKLNVRVIE